MKIETDMSKPQAVLFEGLHGLYMRNSTPLHTKMFYKKSVTRQFVQHTFDKSLKMLDLGEPIMGVILMQNKDRYL